MRPAEFLRVAVFGLNQRDFADIVGMSQSTYQGYETGLPRDHEKLPLFALRRARRYALEHDIPWPRGFTDRLLDEECVLVE